jgi:thiol-disulfide isomerase/thioredoxin
MQAQNPADKGGPTSEKAQKAYKDALSYLHLGMTSSAIDSFKKADKEDGGHCTACQQKMVTYGIQTGDWKSAEGAARELIAAAQGDEPLALAHYQLGLVFFREGLAKHKDEQFAHAHEEFTAAIGHSANFPAALFADGRALSYLKQDDAAKARFEQFVQLKSADATDRGRAMRYISQPELARARMAPPFAVTTSSGEKLSLDDLQGKVVLVDFWATWCGPCRAAMPSIKKIANKFQGEPFVVLSVSLDSEEQKWKDFVAQNEMTWPQYFDGGFNGTLAKSFNVNAIPHTFTIDADGVLQDEHIGDTAIEGKIKKLLARAHELQATQKPAAASVQAQP